MDYSKIAHLYDTYVTTDIDLPFFLEETKGCLNVLELMSGTGRLSIPLIQAGIPLTCVDNSPEMLAILRKKLTDQGLQAEVYDMDVRNLKLQEEFDLIFIPFHAFSEILDEEDQVKALTGIKNLLAVKGRFICTLHNPKTRLKSVNNQLRKIGEYPLLDNQGTLIVTSIETYQKSSGCVKGTQGYGFYDKNGIEQHSFSIEIQFLLHEKHSFENFIKRHRFHPVALYGDYSRSSFEKDRSPFMIWVFKKK